MLLERITQQQVREHKALQTYISEMLETGKWNLRYRLTHNAQQVLAREYRTNYLHREDDFASLEVFHEQITKNRENWKAELNRLGETCRSIIREKGIQDSDFAYGSNGTLYKFLVTVGAKSYQYEFDKKRLAMGFEAKTALDCGSKNPGVGYLNSFKELQSYALQAREICSILMESDIFYDNLNLLKVFHLIGESIVALQDEQNMRRLNDAQDLIEHIIHDNSISFLYEKAGLRFHHLLLDEFQDTSQGQWNCLSPLLEEAVSSNNTCLIVGDVKQSIYRWRDGDWRILGETVPREFSPYIKETVLKKNWRSCAQIVDFNNHVFKFLPEILAKDYGDEHSDTFTRVYKDVSQEIKDPSSGGYIEVHFSEDPELLTNQLGPRIHQVLQRGYRCSDIAVLVRNKKHARAAADAIMEYQAAHPEISLEIISQESLCIESSVTVQWMLAMFRLAQLPQRERHYSNQLHIQEALVTLHQMYPAKAWEVDSLCTLADELHQKGILWGLEALTSFLVTNTDHSPLTEAAFIQAFHDLVNEYCQEGSSGIRSFLEWWDKDDNLHYIQTPPGKDAISIMTVHKSKGLEFPVVLIPSCDFGIQKLSNSSIWAYPDSLTATGTDSFQSKGISFPSTPLLLKWNKKLKESIYAPRYKKEQEMDCLEALNLFYVALTRAKCELHLWSPIKQSKKEATDSQENLGAYFYAYFANQEQWPLLPDPDHSEHFYCRIGEPAHSRIEHQDMSTAMPLEYTSYPRNIALKVHPYANRHPQADEIFDSPRTYGILMHRILECLETPQDLMNLLVDDRFLDVPQSDLAICLKKIEKALQNPIALDWFNPEWELYKEAEILLPTGCNMGNSLRPDRVMIKGDEAVIVDYKFGEQALLQEKKHKLQIRQYREQMQAMEPQKTKIKLYLWYIDKDRILEVS